VSIKCLRTAWRQIPNRLSIFSVFYRRYSVFFRYCKYRSWYCYFKISDIGSVFRRRPTEYRPKNNSLTTRETAWYIISVVSVCLAVCMSVCQTTTSESLGLHVYLAAFLNAGESKSSDVENDAKFRTFWPLWKLEKRWARSPVCMLKLYLRSLAIHTPQWSTARLLSTVDW